MYKFLILFFSVFLFASENNCGTNIKDFSSFVKKNNSELFLNGTCYQEILKTKKTEIIDLMFLKFESEKRLYSFNEKYLISSIIEEKIDKKYIDVILKKENNIEDIKVALNILLNSDLNYTEQFLNNNNLNKHNLYYNLLNNRDYLFEELIKNNLIDISILNEIFEKSPILKINIISDYLKLDNKIVSSFLLKHTSLKELTVNNQLILNYPLFINIISNNPNEYVNLIKPFNYYIGFLLIFIICLFIISKNIIDIIYQIITFPFSKLKIKTKFKSDNLEDFKTYSNNKIINHLKSNFRNNLPITFSNHKVELISSLIKNKINFSFSIETTTSFGLGSSPDFRNSKELFRMGNSVGENFIRNKENFMLLKETLNNCKFGQHDKVFKRLHPEGSYTYSCSTCFGTGSFSTTETYTDSDHNTHTKTVNETCSMCCGTGFQNDTVNVIIEINDFDYSLEKISNNNNILKEGIIKNVLCKNVSKYSKTISKKFIFHNGFLLGEAEFESIYCESILKMEDTKYPLKTFGDEAIILDLSGLGNSFLKDVIENYIKPFNTTGFNYFGVRKQENILKKFFKFRNNRIILSKFNQSNNYKQAAFLSNNSVSLEYVKNMIYKTKPALIQLRASCMVHSILFSFIFSICFYNLKNGGFWIFIGSILLFYGLSLVGYGYFLFRLFLIGGIPLLKYGHSIPFNRKK